MWKCPDCGFEEGPVFDIYSGHNAYHPGGVSLRCANQKTVTGKGYSHSEGCSFEVHVKRDELVQLVLGFAVKKAKAEKDRADMERVYYELRRDTTRREPGDFVIARVSFSGAQYLTHLGRWSNAAEAQAALAAYLQSQGLAA